MTSKDIFTGQISIKDGAIRPDLEITPIPAGNMAESAYLNLGQAIIYLRRAALTLPAFADMSEKTCLTICEAEEILTNLKVRLDFGEPQQTSLERGAKNKP
jgi:hypothetical protein